MLTRAPSILPAKAVKGLRIAIVAARYNGALTDGLLRHTAQTLERAGVRRLTIVRVPGSYEIPTAVMPLAKSRRFGAVIALGVVFQGRTAHADQIGIACAINLQRIAMETGVPVIHQILSPKNLREARARIRVRGIEAAQAALEMAAIMKNIK